MSCFMKTLVRNNKFYFCSYLTVQSQSHKQVIYTNRVKSFSFYVFIIEHFIDLGNLLILSSVISSKPLNYLIAIFSNSGVSAQYLSHILNHLLFPNFRQKCSGLNLSLWTRSA
jgi:hypothetical protein